MLVCPKSRAARVSGAAERCQTAHRGFRQYNHASLKKNRTALTLQNQHGESTSVQNESTMHFFCCCCQNQVVQNSASATDYLPLKSIEFCFSQRGPDYTFEVHIHPLFLSSGEYLQQDVLLLLITKPIFVMWYNQCFLNGYWTAIVAITWHKEGEKHIQT